MIPVDAKPKRTVKDLSAWWHFILYPLAWGLRLWWFTLRIKLPEGTREIVERLHGRPRAVLLWHNRLFAVPYLHKYISNKEKRKIYGLVSASKDGAFLASFLEKLGLGAIRGSSSWRGREALHEITKVLQSGGDIAITPDGPRGPCYDFKPGAVLAAKFARCPIMLISCKFSAAIRLKGWDGFYIPLPFSKITFQAELLESIDDLGEGSNEELAKRLAKKLLDITED